MNAPSRLEIRGIYDGVELLPLKVDTQGWNSNGPIFAEAIKRIRPEVIVEVGSWKGASAIHMANLTRKLGPDCIIYAVDLWIPPIGVGLGEVPKTQIPEPWQGITFYHQFLFNVKSAGVDDMIIPVRGLTTCIATLLHYWSVKADLIYVDASHDELSVYNDLKAYWPILRTGGILFGDDYSSHEGVRNAVNRFALEVGRTVEEFPAQEGTQWMLSPK